MTARILVVDDLPANTRLLRNKLISEYYQVACASDAFDALALAYIWKPDLILLDVMMPGMDGYECCRILKAEESTAHIPVMMITALSEPEQRVRALHSGADELLTKPLDYDIFLARTRSLVRLKRLTDEWLIKISKISMPGLSWDNTTAAVERQPRALVLTAPHDVDDLSVLVQSHNIILAVVNDGVQAICLASFLHYQLVVVNLLYSSDDALRLVSILRASSSSLDVPILLITAPAYKAQTVIALSLGANDCIPDPIDKNEFQVRIRNQLRKQFFRNALRADLGAVLETALFDTLTGVHNRAYLSRYIERRAESRSGMSVIMLDVDHFKQINDTLGHIYGDQVLHAVAGVLKRNLRSVDIIVRYGGEEFAILVPTSSAAEAHVVAERLRYAVEQFDITIAENRAIRLTVSVGVAVDGSGSTSIEQLIRAADEELYAAKRGGRNCTSMRSLLFHCRE